MSNRAALMGTAIKINMTYQGHNFLCHLLFMAKCVFLLLREAISVNAKNADNARAIIFLFDFIPLYPPLLRLFISFSALP